MGVLNRLSWMLVLALVAAAASAQARFGGDATVVSVEVPVNVIRDGAPVRGLTRADFEITEGRKKQTITGFEVVDLSQIAPQERGRGAEIPQIAIGGRRHFLLLFDMGYSDLDALDRARSAARQIVTSSLHPSDLIGVATYHKARGTRLVLGFTGNRDQAEAAIRNLGMTEWKDRVPDPLGLVVAGSADISAEANEGAANERQAERQLLEGQNAADLQIGMDRQRLLQAKSDFLSVTETFAKLAGMVSSADGRKHVVLLSQGFNSEILTGVDDQARQIEINQASELGQTWAVNSDERYGDSSASSSLESMVSAFRQADCTIQAVDIGGLDANDNKLSRNEAMFRMADQTGGELVQNLNNVGAAMGAVLDRTSVTYLLSFEPSNLKMDGKFRPIKVKLKNGSRGTRLLHKTGYYPPKEYSQMNPLERRLTTASEVLGGDDGGAIATSVLAAPFAVEAGEPYVPVLIEIDGATLLASTKKDTIVTELYAYAFDETGAVRDFFTRRLGLDAKASRAALLQSGFKYWGHLDLEPGDYVIRVMTRNGESGESGVASVPLRVPDFASGESALLPPLFPEPMGKWVMGREDENEQRAGVEFPFMMAGNAFIPAAMPGLGAEPTQLSIVGYNLGDGELSVSAKLLDESGAQVKESSLALVDRSHGSGGMQRLVVQYDPGKLAKGSYTLVTTVKDLAGGAEHQSSTSVVVGP